MDNDETDINYEDRFCIENVPEPCGLVIFGASGDLTKRKLIPALFNLFNRMLMPDYFFIIGTGRSPLTDGKFRQEVRESITTVKEVTRSQMNFFAKRCYFVAGEYNDLSLYRKISTKIMKLKRNGYEQRNTVFYLSTPPSVYETIIEMLGVSGLVKKTWPETLQTRVVIEKPFGHDLESAKELDRNIHRYLTEDQIYRIDHYLGKETVQNILMFRFANAIFEPVWNRRYVDNVQIVVTETIGIEHRAGYFEQSGLLRDMFQNHMLQMLSLVAMEPPASFDANDVRDEKVKLLRAVRPFPLNDLDNWVVRGQYQRGKIGGKEVPEYREEKGVSPDSQIETYVAAKLMIDNWRWQGVPFHISSGKRLNKRLSEIAIVFKEVPHSMFQKILPDLLSKNILILNVQPHEGVSLRIEAKSPGGKLCMSNINLEFCYKDIFGHELPDAYERLLLDCMLGDQTLFIRSDDLEVAWSLFTPVLSTWRDDPQSCPLYSYPAGSRGIAEAGKLLPHYKRYRDFI